MNDPVAPLKVPWKARLPWFFIWVPVFLLLYTLVNGAGHLAVLGRVKLCDTRDTLAFLELLRVPYLWRAWALPVYFALPVLAYSSWILAPEFSRGVRWTSGYLCLCLLWLLVFVQGWMLMGCRGGCWEPKKILFWIWRPHFSKPGLTPSAQEVAGFLDEEYAQLSAAWALSEMGAKEFAPDIAKLLKNPASGIRQIAVESLGKLDAKECAPGIVGVLRDREGANRRLAGEALGQLGAKECAPDVAKLLGDSNGEIRASAAYALAQLGTKEFALGISKLLDDPVWFVRRDATHALLRLRTRDYAPQIANLLHDPNANVRDVAAEALIQFGAKECAPQIVLSLRDQDRGVRATAAYVLSYLHADECAPEVATLLRAPDPEKRILATELLRSLDGKRYASAIAALLTDRDPLVRQHAAWALGMITGQGFPYTDPGVLSAQVWWDQHKNDSEYASEPKP